MRILAIDPGNIQTAYVLLENEIPVEFDILLNHQLRAMLPNLVVDHLAIEYMRARGMPTANEELDTQFWAGRFVEAYGGEWRPVYRRDVKLHHCGQSRAKDSNIRQALIDRFGGKDAAIGKKKTQGPLYGIKKDLWSALAIGLLSHDLALAGRKV